MGVLEQQIWTLLESLPGDRSQNLAWMLEAVRRIFLSVLTALGLLSHFSHFYGTTLNVILPQ